MYNMENKNTRRGNTQIVVNKKGHSRGFLSGIYNASRCQTMPKTLLNGYVEDPRYQLSGMTTSCNCWVEPDLHKRHSGFTLIELLVVVLIIGILAAVAVPQYQKAVWKARMAQVMTFGASAQQAVDLYVQEYGTLGDDEWISLTGTAGNNPTVIGLLENLTCSEYACQDDYFRYDAGVDETTSFWRVALLENVDDTIAECENKNDGKGWNCDCTFQVENGRKMCQIFQKTFGGSVRNMLD